jgi:predicted secreted protein
MDAEADLHVLRVGADLALRFRGRGGGYAWQCRVDGPEGVVRVTASSAPRESAAGAPTTGGVDEVFTVHALAAGEVDIHFELRRGWDAAAAPLEERRGRVRVGA